MAKARDEMGGGPHPPRPPSLSAKPKKAVPKSGAASIPRHFPCRLVLGAGERESGGRGCIVCAFPHSPHSPPLEPGPISLLLAGQFRS